MAVSLIHCSIASPSDIRDPIFCLLWTQYHSGQAGPGPLDPTWLHASECLLSLLASYHLRISNCPCFMGTMGAQVAEPSDSSLAMTPHHHVCVPHCHEDPNTWFCLKSQLSFWMYSPSSMRTSGLPSCPRDYKNWTLSCRSVSLSLRTLVWLSWLAPIYNVNFLCVGSLVNKARWIKDFRICLPSPVREHLTCKLLSCQCQHCLQLSTPPVTCNTSCHRSRHLRPFGLRYVTLLGVVGTDIIQAVCECRFSESPDFHQPSQLCSFHELYDWNGGCSAWDTGWEDARARLPLTCSQAVPWEIQFCY